MVASTSNWVPVGWETGVPHPSTVAGRANGSGGGSSGGRDEMFHFWGTADSGARKTLSATTVQVPPPPAHCAELLEAFDAESFVDRLVEDDPLPWRAGGFGISGYGDQGGYPGDVWAAARGVSSSNNNVVGITWTPTGEPTTNNISDDSNNKRLTTGGAVMAGTKLFLQPPATYDWPLAITSAAVQDQVIGGHHHAIGCGVGGAAATAVHRDDIPIVIPHDPILDALLFTPARTEPEILPTVTSRGFWHKGGRGGDGEVGGFSRTAAAMAAGGDLYFPQGTAPLMVEPSAQAQLRVSPRLVAPNAPLRPQRQLSFGYGFQVPGPNSCPKGPASTFDTSVQQQMDTRQLHQQQLGLQPQHGEQGAAGGSGGITEPFMSGFGIGTTDCHDSNTACFSAALFDDKAAITSSPTSSPSPKLTGADSFSEEYDDDRNAFLRQQELANFVGPGYLAGAGRPGLVTPVARTALVDWLSRLHSTAPVASGGGPPLSPETLFLAVNVVDRFLSTAEGARTAFVGGDALKLTAAAALTLASKYEDTQPISLWGVAAAANTGVCAAAGGGGGGAGDWSATIAMGINSNLVSGDARDGSGVGGKGDVDVAAARKELAAMEMRVASALGFRLTVPTALSFLGVFVKRAVVLGYLSQAGQVAERVGREAQKILLSVLRDASSLEHPPSALAATALYWASCITCPGQAAPTSFAFFAVTGYQLDKLSRCLQDMEKVRTGLCAQGYAGNLAGGDGGCSGSDLDSTGGWAGSGGWAGAAFPAHAANSLFGAGGGHPAIAAL
ncbi:unnamed protein product [Sphacelaria rigidula]